MPILVDLGAELVVLMSFLLAIAMLHGYRFSIRPVLVGLAWILQHFAVVIPWIGRFGPGQWLADRVHELDNAIMAGLSGAVTVTEGAMANLWNGSAELMAWLGRELAGLAHDTAVILTHLGAVPTGALLKAVERLIARAVGAAYRRLLRLLGIAVRGLGARIIHLVHRVARLEAEIGHFAGFTRKQLRALLRRLAKLGWLAGVASIAALGNRILTRLHLKWLYGYRTLAAFGVATLAALGLGWLRCGNVGKAGNRLCGLDSNLVDLFLLEATLITGAVSLREFTQDIQAVTDEGVSIMRGFIREF